MPELEPRYPLHWPDGQPRTPSIKRNTTSRFQTTFVRAQEDLENEVRLLGGANTIISSWLAVRKDGRPYADQARRRIDDPGVAVYFTKDGRRVVMAVDMYDRPHDNLRAIGLAVKALRDLERHGGGKMLTTAMDGFAALPAPEDPSCWWTVLNVDRDSHIDVVHHAYLARMKATHPDRPGGSNEAAQMVSAAWAEAQQELAA